MIASLLNNKWLKILAHLLFLGAYFRLFDHEEVITPVYLIELTVSILSVLYLWAGVSWQAQENQNQTFEEASVDDIRGGGFSRRKNLLWMLLMVGLLLFSVHSNPTFSLGDIIMFTALAFVYTAYAILDYFFITGVQTARLVLFSDRLVYNQYHIQTIIHMMDIKELEKTDKWLKMVSVANEKIKIRYSDFTEEQIAILHEKLDIILGYHQKRSGLFNAVSP